MKTDDWTERAVCREIEYGHEIFFPVAGDPGLEGKFICSGCPVRKECLDWALTHHEEHGTWGGFTARERSRMRRV